MDLGLWMEMRCAAKRLMERKLYKSNGLHACTVTNELLDGHAVCLRA